MKFSNKIDICIFDTITISLKSNSHREIFIHTHKCVRKKFNFNWVNCRYLSLQSKVEKRKKREERKRERDNHFFQRLIRDSFFLW